ncbi:lysophospholipase L1-like esterase [Paenibacillus endophyticus]|uniref:Lysophospholipase L1-like esterase n=1 Tax=Paenibacillus endophyticus TaxID=1294268 RepID=A0A7W5GD28_9BACL|nr:stalk domain-containing protein [Paenibacillus endophyticus]MBB3155501.1 lysophospholipase L1-like esterase [Paenibacillus endophyticus]
MKNLISWKTHAKKWSGALLASTILLSPIGLPVSKANAASSQAVDSVQGTVNKQDAAKYRIVTLGDSITVGYEPNLTALPYGYVERLYEQGLLHGRTTVSNFGISGLKTGGLKTFVDAIQLGTKVESDAIQPNLSDPNAGKLGENTVQIRESIAASNLIVLTIGGNDVAQLLTLGATLTDQQLAESTSTLLTSYAENINQVIQNLYKINPAAEIIIADQYQPMPEIANATLYPKLVEVSKSFTATVDKLAGGFAAQGLKIKVAHVSEAFLGKEAQLTHMISDRDFHPNQTGYELIAKIFAETIWGSHTTLSAAGGQTINVIVNGKNLETPYTPVIKADRSFIAIQDIVQVFGAVTVWDAKTKTAAITYGDHKLTVQIGASHIHLDGAAIKLDTPAFLNKVGKEHKTYVPLAAIAQGFGLDVRYLEKLRTVFINA